MSLFGTDGMRAAFGTPPLDRSTVQAVGYWFARLGMDRALGEGARPASRAEGDRRSRPLLILGGDTRDSREELTAWLTAAARAAGAEVRSAGVVPTPAVAFLVTELGAMGGVAISASHNSWTDNGVKLFGPDGFKVDPSVERMIEQRVAEGAAAGGFAGADGLPKNLSSVAADAADGGAGGRREETASASDTRLTAPSRRRPDAGAAAAGTVVLDSRRRDLLNEEPGLAARYLDRLRASLPEALPLAGLRIAVDAAHGAAAPHAARLFGALGADCRVTCDRPDGRNINRDCGSTCTDRIVAFTSETGSDLGVALDGDADRAILCDHLGRICDGDVLLYVWASHLAAQDRLPGRRIVATTMSNMGLEQALARRGIDVLRCGIGDREVARTMRREDVRLGGEQSGHLLDLNLATTGDGLLTAIAVARIVASSGRSLADLASGFRRFPQVLQNVTVGEKLPLETLPGLSDAVCTAERELGASGRVLLRYSGTEPLARVMIEGPDQQRIEELCSRIARVIESELGVG